MDISKRKVRLSLERLETREVPARLGQIVELPYAAAPVAEVALAAPADLAQGGEASEIDARSSADVNLQPRQGGGTSTPSDTDSVLKVQFEDVHYVSRVGKHSPLLHI